MARVLGFLQLLIEPVAHAGKEALVARLDGLFNVLRFVITLVAIAADGHQIHVHYCFGRRIRRGVRSASSGIAGLPAVSHAPTMNDATAEMESLSRRSSVVSVPFANPSK